MITNKLVKQHYETLLETIPSLWEQRIANKQPLVKGWFVAFEGLKEIPVYLMKLMTMHSGTKKVFVHEIKKILKKECYEGIILILEAHMATKLDSNKTPKWYNKLVEEGKEIEAYERLSAEGSLKKIAKQYGYGAQTCIFISAEDDELGSDIVLFEVKKDKSIKKVEGEMEFTEGRLVNLFS